MDPVVIALIDVWRKLHERVRDEIRGLDAATLNWTPGPETSSMAVLVTHMLGSELETLMLVRGLTAQRDRPSEFVVQGVGAADLERRLDLAAAALEEHGGAITLDDLVSTRVHPRLGTNRGGYWLVTNYGHANEHLGQLQLTKQLYRQRQNP